MTNKQKTRSYMNPHDRYIKEVLSLIPVAREFFEVGLSALDKETVDLSCLEHQNTSFISKKLRLAVADILYKVKLHEDDEPGYY